MRPGEHSLAVRLPARQWGHLRDTVLILMTGPRVMAVMLHRWPLEGTVAETAQRHGTGVLWIDGCRVAGINPSVARREASRRMGRAPIPGTTHAEASARGRIERRGSPEAYMQEHPGERLGRWPSNLILVHGPGCRRVGEEQVAAPVINRWTDGMKPFGGGAGHGYEQSGGGTETVDVWDCQADCPVRVLDGQSGELRARGNLAPTKQGRTTWFGDENGADDGRPDPGDAGTASRFFPQFACLDDAFAWLQRLIGVGAGHDENRDVP